MIALVIADDEIYVREGLRDSIDWKSLGVTVVDCVGNGHALYEACIRHKADIALVDIRMPGMDGLTAIERIRPEVPHCQFILFTAYEEFSLAKRAIDLGVIGYLTKPVSRADVMEKVRQAIGILGKSADSTPELSNLDRICAYMKDHLSEGLSLLDVADYMQMNPTYLSRYFKEKMGMNFVDYHRHLRIERAKALLTGSNLRMYEIAERVGYQNPQHFATAFREETGMTPGLYRQCPQQKEEENQ
ncbi:MAG: response regulator [Clostridia bacterium]|nr:response regulator [Clostridia bacterium]